MHREICVAIPPWAFKYSTFSRKVHTIFLNSGNGVGFRFEVEHTVFLQNRGACLALVSWNSRSVLYFTYI
jgi:hypothetical protein